MSQWTWLSFKSGLQIYISYTDGRKRHKLNRFLCHKVNIMPVVCYFSHTVSHYSGICQIFGTHLHLTQYYDKKYYTVNQNCKTNLILQNINSLLLAIFSLRNIYNGIIIVYELIGVSPPPPRWVANINHLKEHYIRNILSHASTLAVWAFRILWGKTWEIMQKSLKIGNNY